MKLSLHSRQAVWKGADRMERLAIYLRLSQEDEGIGSAREESNSISNQRKQIYRYIQHDPELYKYERVEFCEM